MERFAVVNTVTVVLVSVIAGIEERDFVVVLVLIRSVVVVVVVLGSMSSMMESKDGS